MKQQKEDASMLYYEMVMTGLGLLAAAMVAALFFCRVEMAPRIVRETERSARFSGLPEKRKLSLFG